MDITSKNTPSDGVAEEPIDYVIVISLDSPAPNSKVGLINCSHVVDGCHKLIVGINW